MLAVPLSAWPAPERGRVVVAREPDRAKAVAACLDALEFRACEGRDVALFRLDGGKHRGAIGPAEGLAIERLVAISAPATAGLRQHDREVDLVQSFEHDRCNAVT